MYLNTYIIYIKYSYMFRPLLAILKECTVNIPLKRFFNTNFDIAHPSHDKWVPVTTAWRVLRLRMEKRPADMEGSCEYFE
jgi:hypothetical protein